MSGHAAGLGAALRALWPAADARTLDRSRHRSDLRAEARGESAARAFPEVRVDRDRRGAYSACTRALDGRLCIAEADHPGTAIATCALMALERSQALWHARREIFTEAPASGGSAQ